MKIMRNSIKMLGAYGGKGIGQNTTCIQVNDTTVIDAGNILRGMGKKAQHIDNIFVTHSHFDHIIDIPFIIDTFFDKREKPITIYGREDTIRHIKEYIFNWDIWPNFSSIELIKDKVKAIEFKVININDEIILDDDTIIKAIQNNHTNSSCGYLITKNSNSVLFTSDTYKCPSIWDEINNNKAIKCLIIDVSFPSKFAKLAQESKHLTPDLLKEEFKQLKRGDLRVYVNHLKPPYKNQIEQEVNQLNLLLNNGKILHDADVVSLSNEYDAYCDHGNARKQKEIDQLIEIGGSLTSEKNFDVLMEKIMLGAKEFASADGGTLYMLSDDEQRLEFKVVHTDSLGIKMGGAHEEITWPQLELYREDGTPNNEMVAALCALEGKLINIPDVYEAEGFNFEGTKNFDKNTGYRTKSMLVVPMKNHENDVIGVLQLLNKKDKYGSVISFTEDDKNLIRSMSSQAAITITNNRLIEGLENLLDSFIKSIATTISDKSLYTGGHINRVAEISEMITKAIAKDEGVFAHINYSDDEIIEISKAAWLHDIGKIVQPEYIVDKGTKLETIFDRINIVKSKFEIAKRDIEIDYLKKKASLSDENEIERLEIQFKQDIVQVEEDLKFIINCNTGGEFMEDEKIERIKAISQRKLLINSEDIDLLSQNEVYNLSIKKGTLNDEEREIINNHVTVSYTMLKDLPFPKKLKRIPVIAASHHKKAKGGGYGADEIMHLPMTLEDKILAVADVFEALTANDRPYKKANSLNTSLRILSFMVKDGDLDRDIVKFFVDKKLHLIYADKYLKEDQKDEITVDFNTI